MKQGMMKKRILMMVLILTVLVFGFQADAFARQKLTKEQKAAAKLKKMEDAIEKYLGGKESWKANVFKDLRLNMPCKEVRKHFKGLKCQSHKKYDFPVVMAGLGKKVYQYKFTFKYGKLQSATIVWGSRMFDAKRFTQALHNVAQRKWGVLKPEKLQANVKVWTNSDYDSVTLSYSTHNSKWSLKISMPKKDTGDVHVEGLDVPKMKEILGKVLGTSKYWNAASLAKFRFGMTCNEARAIYSSMKDCDPAKSWSFGKVTITKHPLVHALKFSFKQGRLYNATIVFHRQLPKEQFKQASLAMFEAKWGKVKPEKRDQDILTIYKSGFGIAQRSYSVDHWEIKHDFPKPKK